MACLVVMVNEDRTDTHAVTMGHGLSGIADAVEQVVELAMPDDGAVMTFYRVETDDPGTARLFLAPRRKVGSGIYSNGTINMEPSR